MPMRTYPRPMARKQESLGQTIKRLMGAAGLNQTSLAAKSGVDRSRLNRIVAGKREPTDDELAWIAGALGVAASELQQVRVAPADSPAARRAIDRGTAAIERVLRAEGERDEATARAKSLEGELERLREDRMRDLAEAAERLQQVEAQAKADQREIEEAAARKEKSLRDGLTAARAEVDRWKASHKTWQGVHEALRQQVEDLQRKLASTQANKAASQLFAGVVGLALGRALD